MRGEESAAMPPEPGPDSLAIRAGKPEGIDPVAGKELEPAFVVRRRKGFQAGQDLEEEHEPVGLPLVAVFTDQPREMEAGGRQLKSQFLPRLTAGGSIRRFAGGGFQFSAARAPETSIRFAGTLEEERFIALIEDIEQRGDAVGQRHCESETGKRGGCKRVPTPAATPIPPEPRA